jgi:hypothetical protein
VDKAIENGQWRDVSALPAHMKNLHRRQMQAIAAEREGKPQVEDDEGRSWGPLHRLRHKRRY